MGTKLRGPRNNTPVNLIGMLVKGMDKTKEKGTTRSRTFVSGIVRQHNDSQTTPITTLQNRKAKTAKKIK